MFSSIRTTSVTRRLIEQYFMFGLACLFFCLAVCLALAWRGVLPDFVPATVILPLVILLWLALSLSVRALRPCHSGSNQEISTGYVQL